MSFSVFYFYKTKEEMMNIVLGIIVFMLGACLGGVFVNLFESDYNTSILKFKICCPHCKHKFKLIDAIPIFSYIISDGKCKYCGKSIGIKSLWIEVCTGALLTLGYFSMGINFKLVTTFQVIKLIEFLCMFITLIIISNIDLKIHRINKKILLFGIVAQAAINVYYYLNIEITNFSYYRYVLYLIMTISLFVLDIIYQKRIAANSYIIDIVLLLTYIITTIEYELFVLVLLNTLVLSLFNKLFNKVDYIKNDSTDILKEVEQKKINVGFWLCINTIIISIIENYLLYVL